VQTPVSPERKSETVVVPLLARVPLVALRELVAFTPWEFQALATHARGDELDELLKVKVQL
jgi:hypothetical protein